MIGAVAWLVVYILIGVATFRAYERGDAQATRLYGGIWVTYTTGSILLSIIQAL